MNLLVNKLQRLAIWARDPSPPLLHPYKFRTECVVCSCVYSHKRLYLSPCPNDHYFCRFCLTSFFNCALSTPSHFPHCCGYTITPKQASHFLGPRTCHKIDAQIAKSQEHNPAYCCRCGWYIPQWKRKTPVATCEQCNEGICKTCMSTDYSKKCIKRGGVIGRVVGPGVCGMCFKKTHSGPCADGSDKLLQLANKKKWIRCEGCRSVVEKISGCRVVE
ncbi:hypothetical protein BO78DRAFT_148154 [Aspergillus sclerotiicarbonarius CBS 121057]|uniref:RING-type domain-containing protein n=1 Tax=Aspergillus sclerotiicarbonarius (strain CBS 121057 / IBT 28362) TaxID=1448318 RepID=A0A319E5R5_ASPSB|nr:hypothetical protein BO78DRAFT_148154 [Aspergillus sclerotiicarbonarius CBS 121057]